MVQTGIDWVGHALIGAGGLGLFIYGLLNRLLLVTGLHHILNSLVWFVFGSYPGPDGKAVNGDLHRFFAGDPTAGSFMTGFFPIMMFGLPAACLAMYHAARPENRKLVGGMLMSMALTAFLTGVTEPVEFTFMFLAPILYVIHGILTGISMALMNFLGVRLGFTFSAGAFDYIISYRLGTNGWMLIPVGLAYFVIYYFLFSFAIRKFNLATPGRADASLEPSAEAVSVPGGTPETGGTAAPLTGAVAGSKRIPILAVIAHIRELHRDGALLYFWSSGGADYARMSAEELDISQCFTASSEATRYYRRPARHRVAPVSSRSSFFHLHT